MVAVVIVMVAVVIVMVAVAMRITMQLLKSIPSNYNKKRQITFCRKSKSLTIIITRTVVNC